MISIAVLGYGTVGSGVVEVLEKNKDVINQRAGDEISVKYVLDLRDFPGDPIQEKIVHDIDVIINDPEVQIVVEVMGGVEPVNQGYLLIKTLFEYLVKNITPHKIIDIPVTISTDESYKKEEP